MSNNQMQPNSAFSRIAQGLVKRLLSPVTIRNGDQAIQTTALWDTGATNTCISKSVIIDLNLVSTGRKTIHTPSGQAIQSTYLVDIDLPNNVPIRQIPVFGSELDSQGIGALIGMDIIGAGDFAVSNYENKTSFTFRMPSIKRTDYVEEIKAANVKASIALHGKGNTRKRHKKK